MRYNWCRILLIGCFSLFFCENAKCQFSERALDVGVDHLYKNAFLIGGGVAIFDVDNDGWEDMFIVGGESNSLLFINEQDEFSPIITYLALEDIGYYEVVTSGVIAGDVNNDGWKDLFVTTGKEFPNLLMINNRDNTFDVISPDASGLVDSSWSVSASFGDYNKDGLLDIAVANYIDTPRINSLGGGQVIFEHVGYTNSLYLNLGDNKFQEVSGDFQMDTRGNSLAVTFTDYDNDNDVDIYIVNDFGEDVYPNELYQNQYPVENFTDVSVSSKMDVALYGMGVAIGDYDNDLDLDYYVTNLGKNELLNNDNGIFEKRTDFAGVKDSTIGDGLAVGWGTGFLDYDNDGWLDLYMSNGFIPSAGEIYNPVLNPSAFYSNNKNGTFTNISRDAGVEDNAKSRGSAYGDLNNDGFLDLVMVPVDKFGSVPDSNFRNEVLVYYNVTNNENNWVKLDLEGTESNRDAFGAHIFIYDNNGNVQMREIDGGSSHASSNSSIAHFGIGNATTIDSIHIVWPNGIEQNVYDVAINQMHSIVESEDVVNTTITNELLDISVFPNPAKDKIELRMDLSKLKLSSLTYEIWSIDGKLMLKNEIIAEDQQIDINLLEKGSYLLYIYAEHQIIASKELIKQ